jgi:transposase-like protein
VQAGARRALNEIILAEDRTHAERAIDAFAADYGVKWPKAVAKVTGETERLLCFFDYPAEHRIHLRTTNPIESSFSPVRARTRVTKGPGTKDTGLAMVFKLLQAAEATGGRSTVRTWSPGPRRRPVRGRQADRTTRPDTGQGGRRGRHQGRRVIMPSPAIHRI